MGKNDFRFKTKSSWVDLYQVQDQFSWSRLQVKFRLRAKEK